MEISAGLVLIHNNKILLVHPTNGKWVGTYSIPKGHVEKNEDYLAAAIRETQEEVGLIIEPEKNNYLGKGHINYKDEEGNTYKRVYYFVYELLRYPVLNKNKFQIEEVDWAGFLDKIEARKRIFWRLEPLLKYLK